MHHTERGNENSKIKYFPGPEFAFLMTHDFVVFYEPFFQLKDKYPNFEVGLKCILMVNPYLLVCTYIK